MAKKLVGFFLIGFGMLVGTGFGQTRLYTSYTKADGLPSDYVMQIYQAPSGLMWFGTERGAASYDGERFTTYTTEDGLPHNLVYDIMEDSQGRTWFATQSPSIRYLKNGRIHHFLDSTGTSSSVSSISMDRNGRILFRFFEGIGLLNGDDYEFHPIDIPISKESNMVRLFDGRVLFTDAKTILVSRLDSGTDFQYDTLLVLDRSNNFTIMQQAADSTIYISLPTSLGRYRLENDRLVLIESIDTGFFTTMEVLNGPGSNRVIIGSRHRGLSMVQHGDVSQIITSQGSQNNHVSSQLVDYEGNLWVAHFGQGVQKITAWNATVFDQESGIRERNVWRVDTHRGSIIAMSVAGVQTITNGVVSDIKGLDWPVLSVRSVYFSRDRFHIASMSSIYIYEFDSENQTVDKRLGLFEIGDGVNDILYAKDGTLWIAAAGKHVFRRMKDGSMIEYPVENGVERLYESGNAIWWLTSDDGAFRFEADSIQHFSKKNGHLPSNSVWSLHEDEHGTLIGTSAGLVRIPKIGPPITYQSADGLIGSQVIGVFPTQRGHMEQPRYWVVTRNHLHQLIGDTLIKTNSLATLSNEMAGAHWLVPSEDYTQMILGTGSGVVVYDLRQSGRRIPPPKVAIQSISVNSESFQLQTANPIQLRSSSSTLDVAFSGLSFIKDRDTRFTYRLTGLDNTWSTLQQNRSVRYANLPPGMYEFQVKAVNVDGIESAVAATIRIRILPPFWMHPLFVLVAIAGVAMMIIFVIRWRVNTMRLDIIKRNEQRQFEAIQRIGASISHDIKNTVFSLNLLARNLEKRFDNPEFRKDAIETIESSLNYLSTLVSRLQKQPTDLTVTHSMVDIHELVNAVQKRLSLISGRDITVQIEPGFFLSTDPEIMERILENLVQNAIDATSATDSITITARKESNNTYICVTDTGKGMSDEFIRERLFKPFQSTKSKGIGIGLYTCKELVHVLHGTLQVESEIGKGTTFCIHFVT